eukprot:402514-Rhodomonas_salina.3
MGFGHIMISVVVLYYYYLSKRLDIKKRMDNLSKWQPAVSAALADTAVTDEQKAHQEGELPDRTFPQAELLTALELAHDKAYELAGQETRGKKGIPFRNKTTRALLHHCKTLQQVLKDLKHPAAHGNTGLLLHACSICAELDQSTPPAHEWSLLDLGTLTEHLTACDRLLYKKHNKLIHQMH